MPDLKFSLIQSVVSVPLYWTLTELGFGDRAITTIPLIWLAAWCLVVWRLLSRHRSQRFVRHVIALSVASLLGAYLVGFNAEVFSAPAISGGLLSGRLASGTLGRSAGWVLFVLGVANTPALVVAATAIAVALSVQQRQLRFLALVPGVIAVVMLEASWATGSFTLSKYSDEVERGTVTLLPWGEVVGFGWPLWSGLLAVLCVAILMSAWVAIAGTVFGVTAVAFNTCVSDGTFLLEPLCWYTPEYSGLWMPLWEPGPIGIRDVVFIVLVVGAVLPSLTVAAAPVWSSARRTVARGITSVRGRWRL